MWFGVVCTFIDNDTRHHSDHMLWTHEAHLPQYQRQGKCFLERELKKALRDTVTRAALSELLSTTAN